MSINKNGSKTLSFFLAISLCFFGGDLTADRGDNPGLAAKIDSDSKIRKNRRLARDRFMWWKNEKIRLALKLSDEQTVLIYEGFKNDRKLMMDIRSKIRQAEAALRRSLVSDDPGSENKKFKEVSTLRVKLHKLEFQARKKAVSRLTRAQRKILREILDKNIKKRKKDRIKMKKDLENKFKTKKKKG